MKTTTDSAENSPIRTPSKRNDNRKSSNVDVAAVNPQKQNDQTMAWSKNDASKMNDSSVAKLRSTTSTSPISMSSRSSSSVAEQNDLTRSKNDYRINDMSTTTMTSSETSTTTNNEQCVNTNNNLDYNVRECMNYMSTDNPYDQTALKLNYFQQQMNIPTVSVAMPTESNAFSVYKSNGEAKSMGNIYENCVSLASANRNENDRNDMDNNENLIAISSEKASDSTNNNSNGSGSSSSGSDSSSSEKDDDDCVQKLTSNGITTSQQQQNILLSNYTQSIYLLKATELHDIQEVDGDDDIHNDDENAFISRYGDNWLSKTSTSMTSTFTGRSGNHLPMLSSSFAAAAAASRDELSNPRNPFHQLMASAASSSPPSSSSGNRDDVNESTSVSLFGNATSTNNNNDETCTAFSIGDQRKIVASLAAVANMFANATSTIDADTSSIGSSNNANDGSNSTLTTGIATPDLMNTLQLFIKENGNEYITQFLQVIPFYVYIFASSSVLVLYGFVQLNIGKTNTKNNANGTINK